MDEYIAAKARLWADQTADQVAVGNADDPVVAGHSRARRPAGHLRPPPRRREPPRRRAARARHGGRPRRGARAAPGLPPRPRQRTGRGRHRRHAGAPVDGRREALLRLPGAPPPGDARGRGWRRGLVRRLQGHRAPRHARRRRGLPLRRPDRRRAEQGSRPGRAGGGAEHIRAVVAIGEAAAEVAAAFDGRPPRAHGELDGRGGGGRRASPGPATSCCCPLPARPSTGTAPTASAATTSCGRVHAPAARGGPASGRRRPASPDDDVLGIRGAGTPRPGPARVRRRSSAYVGLLAIVAVLNLLGLVMVLSASSVVALDDYGSSWYVVMRQAMWLGLGTVALRRRAPRRLPPLAPAGVPALVRRVVAAGRSCSSPASASTVNGASRWLGFGPLSAPAVGAGQAGRPALRRRPPRPPGGVDGRPPPHPAARSPPCFGMVAAAAHAPAQPRHHPGARRHRAVAAVRRRHPVLPLAGLARPGASLAAALALCAPYRRARVLAFLDPWADHQNTGYQNIQSLVGVASGGLTGAGLGESRAKWGFLPYAHTDFIFAIIGEELGLDRRPRGGRPLRRPRASSAPGPPCAPPTASGCCSPPASPCGSACRPSSTSAP